MQLQQDQLIQLMIDYKNTSLQLFLSDMFVKQIVQKFNKIFITQRRFIILYNVGSTTPIKLFREILEGSEKVGRGRFLSIPSSFLTKLIENAFDTRLNVLRTKGGDFWSNIQIRQIPLQGTCERNRSKYEDDKEFIGNKFKQEKMERRVSLVEQALQLTLI